MIGTDTFPGYYYHPHRTRHWCATREDLAQLLLEDARWRGTPYQDADVLALFDEQGIHSEIEIQQAWADMYNAEVQWHHERTKEPFAYCDRWKNDSRVIPKENVLVALMSRVTYGGWTRVHYEVFEAQSRLDADELIALGLAGLASKAMFKDHKIIDKHRPTARFFLTRKAFEEYAARYKRFVIEGGVPSTIPLQDTAPTLEPEAHEPEHAMAERPTARVRRGPGRKPGSTRVLPPTDLFKERLGGIVNKLRLRLKDKDEVSPQDVWEDEDWRKWQNCSSSSSFYRRLEEHQINFPTFLRSLS